jgi:hypothetical protein
MKWADFVFPPINLWNYPKQYEDYMANEEYIKPVWKPKQSNADDMQVGGNHYKDMAIQPWTVMESILTYEEFVGFLKGNIIKYSMRDGKKDHSQDAGKAAHYIAKLAEVQRDD